VGQVNNLGQWSKTYFDGLQRTVKTISSGPEGKTIVSETVYNSLGQVVSSSIPAFEGDQQLWGYTTYDPLGRITRIDSPDGTYVESCYSLNVVTQVDANRHRKRQTSDVNGNLVRVDEYDDAVAECTTDVGTPYATTIYDYDVLGQLTSVTDTHGNQTLMAYDTLGQKRTMDDPDMGHWEYRYDPVGNLVWQKDAKLQEINFEYDSLGRLETKTYPDSSTVTYTYDDPTHGCPGDTATQGCAAGHLTSMDDASGRTDYYYDDPLALVSSKTQTVDGQSYTIETGMDSLGRISYVKYPDDETVGYDYDDAGNLVHVGGYATYEGYNALGQPGKVTYEKNGVTTDYTYDPLSQRLWIIDTAHEGTPLLDLTYGYDNKGNVKNILNGLNSDQTQNFVYDELDRLRSAKSTAYGELAYSYDEIGNLRAKGGGKNFQYNDANSNGIWDEGIDPLLNSEAGDFVILYPQFGLATDTPIVGDWNGDGKKEIGTYRVAGAGSIWNLDINGDQHWDASETVSTTFGNSTDIPLAGDWNGDGIDEIGVWRNGVWLLDLNGNYLWDAGDLQFSFGLPTDTPLVGDWNGDGIDSVGLKRGNNYLLRNGTTGTADYNFYFGFDTDTPVVGDWDNDGVDSIGLKRGNNYLLRNGTSGSVNYNFYFGLVTDLPLAGAWLASAPDRIGVFRQGTWYFDRNGNGLWDLPLSPDAVDYSMSQFSLGSDVPLVGDWNGNGLIGIGAFRATNAQWRLDVDSNGIMDTGDAFYVFGLANDIPVTGDWDGDGIAEFGVFRNGEWRLDVDSDGAMTTSDIFYPGYGLAGDVPVTGVWDGDGVTEIGVFRNGAWYLDADNTGVGSAGDLYYPAFGNSTMIPVTGDWDGDGTTEIGAYRDGTWYLDYNGNGVWDGASGGDVQAQFGTSAMTPFTGDWNLDGKTEIGAYDNGTWYFDFNGNGVWDPLDQDPINPVAYTPHPTKPHALATSSDGRTYSYDDNGNMIYDGTRYMSWDYDNLPVSISLSGGVENTYVYDGSGARVKKVGAAGTTVYIGQLYELSGGVPVKYIFANGKRVAVKTTEAAPLDVRYYHQDHLGSTSVVTLSNGTVYEENFYKPFGEDLGGSGSGSSHRFTGQELDFETGLYNYGARYYNPVLGKFISADTIVPYPGNPQTLNRYGYCGNNPVLYVDPSGHFFGIDDLIYVAIFAAKGAVIGAAVGGTSAAVTGGDIGQGILTGAISGAIFGGAGGLIHGAEAAGSAFSTLAQTGIHVAAGATSGGINASITGGDIGRGMLTGALSGGLSKYGGLKFGLFNNLDTVSGFTTGLVASSAIGGFTGGVVNTLYGGSFGQGFMMGARTAAYGFMFNAAGNELLKLPGRVWDATIQAGRGMMNARREFYNGPAPGYAKGMARFGELVMAAGHAGGVGAATYEPLMVSAGTKVGQGILLFGGGVASGLGNPPTLSVNTSWLGLWEDCWTMWGTLQDAPVP
jgi:RHS repeat-associated protein